MGDFASNFKRPDTGAFTVEGNVAGNRAAMLSRQRQKQQEEFERQKQEIIQSSRYSAKEIKDKFGSETATAITTTTASQNKNNSSSTSDSAITQTLLEEGGLVQKKIQNDNDDDENGAKQAELTAEETARREKAAKKARKKALKEKRKMMSTLSFAGADDEDENDETDVLPLKVDTKKQEGDGGDNDSTTDPASKKAKKSSMLHKDPSVDTSFLPDKERDEQARLERARLEQEWKELQEKIKEEKLEIVYSYWDGSGHRRTVICIKGDTIGDFLEKVRKELAKEFREMSNVAADELMYVKEDLIIPQDMTFYDLIATKARGKSGPLFHFDVHDDIRIGAIDVRIEKDESHPGKVVERRWYERNKHIFPASRWEVFNPAKDYGGYTIGDKKKR